MEPIGLTPRSRILMALNGYPYDELTPDERLVLDKICHLEGADIARLETSNERRARFFRLPVSLQSLVKKEVDAFFPTNGATNGK
jgi:hypothetical protein